MGLDIYVGTLTRYYARQWETVVQRAGREHGIPVRVLRSDPDDAVTDPATIEPVVIEWRDALGVALREELPAPLYWDEGLGAPYFTDKPSWDGYASLLVWAAHAEHPTTALPEVSVEDWTQHPAVVLSQADGFRSQFNQLLHHTEFWLPATFDFTFRAEDPGGNAISFGSTAVLVRQLQALNDATWRADRRTLVQWREHGAAPGDPFERAARFGFTVLFDLAERAVESRLPMKLDY